MKMPLAEVIDRYSILKLKLERLAPQNKELDVIIRKEFEIYEGALREFKEEGINVKPEWIDKLH